MASSKTNEKFITPERLTEVANAQKTYIDAKIKDTGNDVPTAAETADVQSIVDLFKVESV